MFAWQLRNKDAQMLASISLFQPHMTEAYIKSLHLCYLLLYRICFNLLLRLYNCLCTGHMFPKTQKGLTQRYHIFISNLCFQF